jgi:hypothetical protein
MDLNGVKWEKVDPVGETKYLNLSSTPEMINTPFKARLDFWDSLHL